MFLSWRPAPLVLRNLFEYLELATQRFSHAGNPVDKLEF
jgi:hypothetical protein